MMPNDCHDCHDPLLNDTTVKPIIPVLVAPPTKSAHSSDLNPEQLSRAPLAGRQSPGKQFSQKEIHPGKPWENHRTIAVYRWLNGGVIGLIWWFDDG